MVVSSVVIPRLPQNSKHMICDDSSLNRYLLRRLLMNVLHIEVDEADGEEMLVQQVVKNGEYVIIWQDFMLGIDVPDGGHAATRLRNELQYKGTIIALTGYTDLVTRNLCKQAGMDDFVPKPYHFDTIKSMSEKYARSAG